MNIKEKLLSGQKVFGTMLRVVRNPAVAYLAQNAGLDFVMYDCEHAGYSMETLHDLLITGSALGLGGLVRVPASGKEHVSCMLDLGAVGVMVPLLDIAAMARQLVNESKYPPVGKRGYTGGVAHCAYRAGNPLEIMEAGNAKVLSIAQIETVEALHNIDAIAAVPGLDALLVGPNDLSISLGIAGDLLNPIELEAIRSVMAASKKHGKLFGLHAGEPLLKLFYDDLDIVMMQTDTDFLMEGFRSIKQKLA